MKVLFIGGTGLISQAVSELAVAEGIELTLLTRGNHEPVSGARMLYGDIYDESAMDVLLDGMTFDVVVDWIAFEKSHVERDIRLFKKRTTQYIFISSASAYQKPIPKYPITEDVPLGNPFWQYSDNKRVCEEYLWEQQTKDFHVTVVRPSHTYNDDKVVMCIKNWMHPFTTMKRILDGKPTIIPGDGTSLWTLTYNKDFAKAFVPLMGKTESFGEAYHITSDFVYTWDQLHHIVAKACGVEPNIIHIPTDFILEHAPFLKGELLGDKSWSMILDNSKIKNLVPSYQATTRYEDIAPGAVKRYLDNQELQTVDESYDQILDTIIERYQNK